MRRNLHQVLAQHFRTNRQMAFVMGPRQVGKTTLAQQLAVDFAESLYLNWDNRNDRQLILAGPDRVAEKLHLDRLRDHPPLVIFDELHKFSRWKDFLKGFFDSHGDRVKILVTGSARLGVFNTGGDSLMGRFFGFRLHPLSLPELSGEPSAGEILRPPENGSTSPEKNLATLLEFGGFPEPFLKGNRQFFNRWSRTRTQSLLKEDLRDLTRIQEIGQVEVLAELLRQRAGQLTALASLSRDIGASLDSIRRWTRTLEALYYCFAVRPWHRNVARALRKEPKFYLWDWSQLKDPGARHENLVAAALLKAVHFWTDAGHGDFALHFLRDKQKREVDFVVVRDDQPWFLVEVKSSGKAPLSPHLAYFQEATGAGHAFQVAMDLPPVMADCFQISRATIIPAANLLNRLV